MAAPLSGSQACEATTSWVKVGVLGKFGRLAGGCSVVASDLACSCALNILGDGNGLHNAIALQPQLEIRL